MPAPWVDRLWDVALAPALWLSATLALIYSALFTLWRGGGWRQLPRHALVGIVGFGAGQLLGVLLASELLRVGEVHLLWGTIGAALALLVGGRRRVE